MFVARDPPAVEVVVARTRLEREVWRIDEQLAVLLRIRGGHRDAGNELTNTPGRSFRAEVPARSKGYKTALDCLGLLMR
jgi:hypothetical protein